MATLLFAGALVVLAVLGTPVTEELRLPAVTGTAAVNGTELLVALIAAVVCSLRSARLARSQRAAVTPVQRVGQRRQRSATVVGWALMALACASWAWGQALWTMSEVFEGLPAPQASLADAGFLGCALLLPLAAVLVAQGGTRPTWRLRVVMDGLITGGAVMVIGWLLVLRHLLTAGEATPLQVVLNAAAPVADLVLLAGLVALLARGGATVSLRLLTAGASALVLADSGYAYLGTSGDFTTGGLLDGLWTAAFLLIAAAAAHASVIPPVTPPRRPGLLTLALPYLPFLVAVVVTASAGADRPLHLADWLPLAALGALVMARQGLQLVDVVRLSQEVDTKAAALADLAYRDPLTGAANRAAFTRAVDEAVGQRRRVVVAFCDLDGFKAVNDTCGHAAGDALLQAVAARLRTAVRPQDVVARLGGDEFGVLVHVDHDEEGSELRGCTGDDHDVQRRIQAAVAPPFGRDLELALDPAGAGLGLCAASVVEAVTVSVGVVCSAEPDADTTAALLSAADQRMYEDKRARRARAALALR